MFWFYASIIAIAWVISLILIHSWIKNHAPDFVVSNRSFNNGYDCGHRAGRTEGLREARYQQQLKAVASDHFAMPTHYHINLERQRVEAEARQADKKHQEILEAIEKTRSKKKPSLEVYGEISFKQGDFTVETITQNGLETIATLRKHGAL